MSVKYYLTGNSRTPIAYDDNWKVLDIGSGHHPHRRANILADKFLLDNRDRIGRGVVFLANKPFVVADACNLPFKSKSFDFVVCSHVAEHIEDVDKFCSELNRVATRGYLETPSRFNETLLHVAPHRWFVSNRGGKLIFSPTPNHHPLGWFGKLFFSVHFYGSELAREVEVFPFAYGVPKPWHYLFVLFRWAVMLTLSLAWPFLFTRLQWKDQFAWGIED